MRPRRFCLPALAGLLLLALAAGACRPRPGPRSRRRPSAGSPTTAGLLSPAAAAELDARLEAFERSSGHQFVVYIGDTTGGIPIEDWAVKAFEAWRVGRKGLDDGLVLFIMKADKRLRIEVGYGLEGVVPDALAARVINDEMVPRLHAGRQRRRRARGRRAPDRASSPGRAAAGRADGAAGAKPPGR